MKLAFSRKTLLSFLLAAILLIGILPGAAFAGSNGQQVSINFSCAPTDWGSLKEVTVQGTNQNGVLTTWKSSTRWCNIGTNGWWWVGSANVTVKYWSFWGNQQVSKYTNVPKSQLSNWWTVNAYK